VPHLHRRAFRRPSHPLVTACNYPIWEGMEVTTDSEDVTRGASSSSSCCWPVPGSAAAPETGQGIRHRGRRFKAEDDTCILCGLCTGCAKRWAPAPSPSPGEGLIWRWTPVPYHDRICIACGACASVCPTGHITLEKIKAQVKSRPKRRSTHPIRIRHGLKGRKPVYVPMPRRCPTPRPST
jgi:heterodisulfide reductase subunit A